MSDIITWLIGIEATAANLYAMAAFAFRDDTEFSRFLSLMSAEEKAHEKLLQKASAAISGKEMKRACFYFDEHSRNKIEAPFTRAGRLLNDGDLTKTSMVDILAEAEFSEWNEIFLHTLDILKILDEDMQKAVSDVDQHRQRIQEFISSLPGCDSLLQKVRKPSQPGSKCILIVENNSSVARMLEALATAPVEIIIASNGDEGISRIRQRHFDLIISEIDLPQMDGIEMYKQALDLDPDIGRRFMFFTGSENPEYLDFLRASKISILPKPSPVKLICTMMNDLLDSASVSLGSKIH